MPHIIIVRIWLIPALLLRFEFSSNDAFSKWSKVKYWFVCWQQPVLTHQNLSSYIMVHRFFIFCAKMWFLNGQINILIQFTLISNAVSGHLYVTSFGESLHSKWERQGDNALICQTLLLSDLNNYTTCIFIGYFYRVYHCTDCGL